MISREEWLSHFVDAVRPKFKEAGYELPEKLHVSIGFPSSGGLKEEGATLGQCWMSEDSEDGSNAIFINPRQKKTLDVAGVLVHELIHAALPSDAGHKKPFKQACEKLGLEGPAKHALPGAVLQAYLEEVIDTLEGTHGKFPHAALVPKTKEKKESSNRQLKAVCPPEGTCQFEGEDARGFIVRLSRGCMEKFGNPRCPCGQEMVFEDVDNG